MHDRYHNAFDSTVDTPEDDHVSLQQDPAGWLAIDWCREELTEIMGGEIAGSDPFTAYTHIFDATARWTGKSGVIIIWCGADGQPERFRMLKDPRNIPLEKV
jgi:hypothetical protein